MSTRVGPDRHTLLLTLPPPVTTATTPRRSNRLRADRLVSNSSAMVDRVQRPKSRPKGQSRESMLRSVEQSNDDYAAPGTPERRSGDGEHSPVTLDILEMLPTAGSKPHTPR